MTIPYRVHDSEYLESKRNISKFLAENLYNSVGGFMRGFYLN
jgi:hypothetical protein